MPDPTRNSPDLLCAEVLAEGRREGEEIIRRARMEAENVLNAAKTDAEKFRCDRKRLAENEAARRRASLLATVPLEIDRLRSARVEMLLNSVNDEIRRRLLAQAFDVRQTVVALAAEAVRQMFGNDFILKISPADAAEFSEGLNADIARRVDRPLLHLAMSADASVGAGGVVVESPDGLLIWDNRVLSRLGRLWPELRRQMAIRASFVADNNNSAGGGP